MLKLGLSELSNDNFSKSRNCCNMDKITDGNLVSLPAVNEGDFIVNAEASKCYRDIGFITDAIVNDLKFGGNINSVQAGEAYYVGNNLTYIDLSTAWLLCERYKFVLSHFKFFLNFYFWSRKSHLLGLKVSILRNVVILVLCFVAICCNCLLQLLINSFNVAEWETRRTCWRFAAF